MTTKTSHTLEKTKEAAKLETALAAIGQGVINIDEGLSQIEKGSPIYDGMVSIINHWELIAAAPELLRMLNRVLAMHECKNNGAYNGEAVLSESVAFEIRDTIEKAEGK